MLFQPFKRSTQARAPQLTQAAISQGQMEQAADQYNRAQRFNEIVGGAKLYNTAMGDRTPIADFMFGPETAAETATTGAETAEALRQAPSSFEALQAAAEANTAAEGAALADAATAGVTDAAATTALTEGAGAAAAEGAAGAAAGGGVGSALMSVAPWLALAYLAASNA